MGTRPQDGSAHRCPHGVGRRKDGSISQTPPPTTSSPTPHPAAYDSEIGSLHIKCKGEAVAVLRLAREGEPPAPHSPTADETFRQVSEYLAGVRRTFSLKTMPDGTPFQKRVWAAVSTIPYGETQTYAQIATMIGSPGAARAVGSALNRNPLLLIVPCHRVIGSSGSLTGYAPGLDIKRRLLEMERRLSETDMP